MRQEIDCFLACQSVAEISATVTLLRRSIAVRHIFLLTSEALFDIPQDCTVVTVDRIQSSDFVMRVAEHAVAPYVLLSMKSTPITIGETALERMLWTAEDAKAAMVYSDRWQMEQTIRMVRCVTTSISEVCY